jgi:hypothetical protein
MKSRYYLDKPEYLVFVDEVGNNTNQEKDGNIGGEKFLCISKERAQQRASTKDAHFSVLGFTCGNGQPIMCAIIFAAKQIDPLWVQGIDPFAAWEGEEREIEKNSGSIGKRHPFGPTCMFNGKEVPCFCCCSKSGSITSELLVAMLE